METGVKPLSMRRAVAVRQAARMMMKPDDACLKVSWDTCSFLDKETSGEETFAIWGK